MRKPTYHTMQSNHDIQAGSIVICNPFFDFKNDDVKIGNGRLGTSTSMVFTGKSKVMRINASGSIRIDAKPLNYARNQLLVEGVDYHA